jgi:hypothetical protein
MRMKRVFKTPSSMRSSSVSDVLVANEGDAMTYSVLLGPLDEEAQPDVAGEENAR